MWFRKKGNKKFYTNVKQGTTYKYFQDYKNIGVLKTEGHDFES
jgi:hypothetical protein